jgi:integration host factor subunit beta
MTKRELVAMVQAEFPDNRAGDITFAVYRVFDVMKEALERGERIDIRDFGNFTIRSRKARQARNPRTAETVKLQERRVPFFKVGKELKELVAGKRNV